MEWRYGHIDVPRRQTAAICFAIGAAFERRAKSVCCQTPPMNVGDATHVML